MKKKFIILFIFLTLGVLGTLYYINAVLIPVQLKQIAMDKARAFLGREITVKEIRYTPFKGIIIRDLTIYQKNSTRNPFVKIEEASFNIPLPGLIKSQKIIIPSLTIRNPSIYIIRRGPHEWNFSDLLTKKENSPASPAPLVFIGNLILLQGRLEVTDLTAVPTFTETFDQTNLNISLSATKGIAYKLQTRIPQQATFLKSQGTYAPLSRNFEGQIIIDNLDLLRYLPLVYEPQKFLIDEGLIKKTDMTISYKDEAWDVNGIFSALLDLYFDPGNSIKGHITATQFAFKKTGPQVDISSVFSVKNGEVAFNNIAGKGDLTSPGLQMILINKHLGLKGDMNLQNADIQIGHEKRIAGSLSAYNFLYRKKEDETTLEGNFTFQDTFLQFSPTKTLKGSLALEDISFVRQQKDFELNGTLNIKDMDFATKDLLRVKGDLKTAPLLCTLKDELYEVETAFQLENAEVQFKTDHYMQGTISSEKSRITMIGEKIISQNRIKIDNGIIRFDDDKQFAGNPSMKMDIRYDPLVEQPLNFAGSIFLNDAQLTGVPRIQEIKNIAGKIDLKTDRAETVSLRCYALDSNFTITGMLKNFKNPIVDVKATTGRILLEKLQPFFAEKLKKIKLMPSGPSAIEIGYKGAFSSPEQARINLTANLMDVSLAGEKLPSPIDNISGRIKHWDNYVSWKNLRGTFEGKAYTLNGLLTNFAKPEIETKIVGEGVALSSNVGISGDYYTIHSLKGTYHNIGLDIRGYVRLKEKGSPDLNLNGHVDLDVSQLSLLGGKIADKIKPLQLQGLLSVDGSYRGQLDQWLDGTVDLQTKSPRLSLYGYTLNNVILDVKQKAPPLTSFDLTALAYDGKLSLTSLVNFKKVELPFKATARVMDVKLDKLKNDTPLKTKDISGNLFLNANLSGFFNKIEDIEGQGEIVISNGRLWKSNLLKGLWKTLLIPEYDGIVFTDAETTFVLKNKRLLTEDLLLKGSLADLSGKGWIDFDKNIDFTVTPKFKQTEILLSKSIKKGPTSLLTGEGYINIKITGTLDQPEYNVNTLPMKMIKKTTDYVIEGIQGIFEEILP